VWVRGRERISNRFNRLGSFRCIVAELRLWKWTTQMSLGKSSRWCGSSARKQRKKPTRSLSPPKRYLFIVRFYPLSISNSCSQNRSCRNSISRSFSWLKLKRRRSGKSMNAKSAKWKFARRCIFYIPFYPLFMFFCSVSLKFIRIVRQLIDIAWN